MLLFAVIKPTYTVENVSPATQSLDLSKFKMVECTPQIGVYTETCGVSSKLADSVYWNVREFLGTTSVSDPIKIYVAKPIVFTGIGYYDGVLINGAYLNNVIVYNGNIYILIHEMAHHFYRHKEPRQQEEIYARLVELHFILTDNNRFLSEQNNELQELLKDKVRNNAN
jgi:hypothetical protein